MKMKRIWSVIGLILIMGTMFTCYTVSQVREIVPEAQEVAMESSFVNTELLRLQELDQELSRSRKQNATASVRRNASENEWELWEQELQRQLNVLTQTLRQEDKENLIRQQKIWLAEREQKAAQASVSQNAAMLEEIHYNLSLAESTRERAYELAETYAVILSEVD